MGDTRDLVGSLGKLYQRVRDFAGDSELHRISHREWKMDRHHGVTLYAQADFFTAYYDDAGVLWREAEDDLPMFHVMVQSDPPPRTVIHESHLAVWVRHLAEIYLPVQVLAFDPGDD